MVRGGGDSGREKDHRDASKMIRTVYINSHCAYENLTYFVVVVEADSRKDREIEINRISTIMSQNDWHTSVYYRELIYIVSQILCSLFNQGFEAVLYYRTIPCN